ncbi:MAG: HNH endonuclease [Gammaproteobacteria bacterium]|nr:HNH endonuclease [Gammaproteobacteria bacterium]
MNRCYGGLEQRLEAFGNFTDFCWEWTGCLSTSGYGRVRIGGTTSYVHRLVVEWSTGRTLAKGVQVDHLCRNRACFRPTHLEAVTPSENTRRGLSAKLTDAQIAKIIGERAAGATLVVLAERYGVHHAHVSRICRGLRRAGAGGCA